MTAAVLVLGPTKWIDDRDPSRVLNGAPLEIRRAIAGRIREIGIVAIVLEDQAKRDDEDNFAFFLRLIDENDVGSFLVFWPFGARLHGLDVEIGHLLTRLSDGSLEPDDVYVLAEKRALDIEAKDGALAWSEPGNRTRYHEDLVARGCQIRRWSTPASLWANVGSFTWDHRRRHGP
ncbi:MAG: hypothetical protein ACT4PT_03345 [Methanobacteriota archaeon]